MDVKHGGEWNLVLHGPDGTDFDNRIIYKEVIKYKKLVFEHQSTPKHVTTVEFESQGDKTQMKWHMTFESREQFVQLVKDFQVDKGLEQNVRKWNEFLTRLKREKGGV